MVKSLPRNSCLALISLIINALIITSFLHKTYANDDQYGVLGARTTVTFSNSASPSVSNSDSNIGGTTLYQEISTCKQIYSAADKCQFARDNCQQENLGYFNYIVSFYCAKNTLDSLSVVLLIFFWTLCLFMTIGIAAYDFLCPNLNTISKILGFSETLAGVTLLALGNGSPDIFSTYAAMKSGSGSLAVGELLGAAVFITSVVTGCMAIISPFYVPKYTFLRDVGFFLVAIVCALFAISDGVLELWECITMFMLYLSYVVMVVAWHYYATSSSHQKTAASPTTGSPILEGGLRHDHQSEYQSIGTANSNARSYASITEPEDSAQGLHHHVLRSDNFELNFDSIFNNLTSDSVRSLNFEDSPDRYGEFTRLMRANRKHDLETQYLPRRRSDFDDHPRTPTYFKTPFKHSGSAIPTIEYSQDNNETANGTTTTPTTAAAAHPGRPALLRHRSSLPGLTTANSNFFGTPVHQPQEPSIRPSFVSAIEFSDALKRLQRHKHSGHPHAMPMTTTNTAVSSPLTQVHTSAGDSSGGGGYSVFPGLSSINVTHFSTAAVHGLNFNNTTSTSTNTRHPHFEISRDTPSPMSALEIDDMRLSPHVYHGENLDPSSPSPSLRLSPPSPTKSLMSIEEELMEEEHTKAHKAFNTLFPSLRNLGEKSWYGILTSLLSAPWVFLLTVSVPVYESGAEEYDEDEKYEPINSNVDNHVNAAQDNDDEQQSASTGVSNLENVVGSENEDDQNNNILVDRVEEQLRIPRWLISLQLSVSPLTFCLLNNGFFKSKIWLLSVPLTFSVILLTIFNLYIPSHMPNHQANHRLRLISILGFLIAVSWIAIIANEVVAVLKAIGIIVNISDSILGLTLFAVGNSLGDLVADITIANMGYPKMAFSACFGGPLLNILVGIGISGMLVLLNKRGLSRDGVYHIDISSTLIISGVTLLITSLFFIIAVPLNGFKMTKKIGITTISLWTVSTVFNLLVEFYIKYL